MTQANATPPVGEHDRQLSRLLADAEAATGPVAWPRVAALVIGLVDLYVGGVEHAVLHLLYARFWHKVLYDLGHVSTPEPFQRLFNQGYILAPAYLDERGAYVDAERVEERDGGFFFEGKPVTREMGKMGKSLRNAVTPDDLYRDYGADTLRLYEMFMGPLDKERPWSTADIVGVQFLIELTFLNGREKLNGEKIDAVLQY